ncbi:Usp3 protein [Gorgonomyces haynaldii]|nr:Usp3 protein [Gorgonomyces haynaldii]
MECKHISSDVFDPDQVLEKLSKSDPNRAHCSRCEAETETRWICLQCGEINCGRFVKGHALVHYKESQHSVALDLETKALHCYICDEYVMAGAFEEELETLRSAIIELQSGLSKVREKTTKSKKKHITGLQNLGNTCFMNVVLQVMCHTMPLQAYFLQPLISPMPSPVLGSRRQQQAPSIWTEFCQLMLDMWDTKSTVLSPDSILRAVWKVVPSFHGYQQQDCQEFIRYLLDAMHSELSSIKGRTVIYQMFQGTLVNTVQCLKCNHISSKQEIFLDLSLEIPSDKSSLIDCLDAFTQIEKLEKSELYDCESCKQQVSATKQMKLDKLPTVR